MTAIRWIKPLYGISGRTVLSATRPARPHLAALGADIAGTDAAVAIYVTANARGYGDEAYRGRIAAAVWLKPMPADRSMDDYGFRSIEGELRWPIGWPIETTRVLSPDEAPALKPLVSELAGSAAWRRMSPRFQSGAPVRLDGALAPVAAHLDALFAP